MNETNTSAVVRVDLRAFFTIGFQDAPNGLWLGVHKLPRKYLFPRFVSTCLDKGLSLVAITTEDDKVVRYSPEDRFGFLAQREIMYPYSNIYQRERIDDNLFKVTRMRDNKVLFVLNSETVHAPQGESWGGLKLQVVGKNRIQRYATLNHTILACNNQGLLTFLTGITRKKAQSLGPIDLVASLCYGMITHDANNIWLGKKSSNKVAREVAGFYEKPGIAVSSAYWPEEMGQAHIELPANYLALADIDSTPRLLNRLKNALNKEEYCCVQNYHNPFRVFWTRWLLAKYGQGRRRFAGDSASSYN
ncbi:MAG: hypothetical protein AABY00_03950 [Nanoarchaeota archaeon]